MEIPAFASHRSRFRVSLLLAGLALALGACAVPPPEMPPVESWGDLNYPMADAIDAAAFRALGHYDPKPFSSLKEIRLADFWVLRDLERRTRLGMAGALANLLMRHYPEVMSDSLAAPLMAIKIAPVYVTAYPRAIYLLVRANSLARAKGLCLQGLRLAPDHALMWLQLGEIYWRQEDRARAVIVMRKALELGGARVDAAEQLASVYIELDQPNLARAVLERYSPERTGWLHAYAKAKVEERLGNWEAAKQTLLAVSNADQTPPIVWIELGEIERQLGEFDASEGAYKRALQQQPHHTAALNGLGLVFRERGELEESLRQFKELVAMKPSNMVAQFNLASTAILLALETTNAKLREQAFVEAELAFTVCVDSMFELAAATEGRAQTRFRHGDLEAAKLDANQLLRWPSHELTGRLLLAQVAREQGRPRDVIAVLRPVAGKVSADVLSILGKSYLDIDQPKRAAQVLTAAHSKAVDNWRITMNLAVALSRSGHPGRAEKLLRDLSVRRPDDANVLINLAAVLSKLGRQHEANKLLVRAEMLRQ